MTLLRTVLKAVSLLTGICLFLLGVVWLLIAASGDIPTGPLLGYVAGTGFAVIAAPFLAFPFSAKAAKALGIFALCVFAVAILWLSFQPTLPDKHPMLTQSVAIAFAVLLFARVGLALRRNRRARLGA